MVAPAGASTDTSSGKKCIVYFVAMKLLWAGPLGGSPLALKVRAYARRLLRADLDLPAGFLRHGCRQDGYVPGKHKLVVRDQFLGFGVLDSRGDGLGIAFLLGLATPYELRLDDEDGELWCLKDTAQVTYPSLL